MPDQIGLAVGSDPLDPCRKSPLPDPAQHGVGEAGGAGTDLLAGQGHGLRGGGVRGDGHVQQLVGTQPHHVQQLGFDIAQVTVDAGRDDRVETALGPQRPVEQLRGEGGVASGDAMAAQQAGQDQVGVGIVLANGAQALEGHLPGGGRPPGTFRGARGRPAAARAALAAGVRALPALAIPTPAVAAVAAAAALLAALVPVTSAASARFAVHARSCSSSKAASGARPAPRAQSGARMARLPAGATISRATGAVPVPTSRWRRVAASRPGGSASSLASVGGSSTPRTFIRLPSSRVHAPGSGLMPRMWALTCSAGRVQSMRASEVDSFGASVAAEWSWAVKVAVPASRASIDSSNSCAPLLASLSNSCPEVSY